MTIKIIYNLALTHFFSHRTHCFESFLFSRSFLHSFLDRSSFTWFQDFVHLPSSALYNLPSVAQLESHFIHESSLTVLSHTHGSFHRIHPCLGHVPPTPTWMFWAFIKSTNNYGFYLALSHSQSLFPWVLAVSIGMCQVWPLIWFWGSFPPWLRLKWQ